MSTLEQKGVGDEVSAGAKKPCCVCGTDLSATARQRDSSGRYWCADCARVDQTERPQGLPPCSECGIPSKALALWKNTDELICPDCANVRNDIEQTCILRRQAVTSHPEHRIRRYRGEVAVSTVAFIGALVLGYFFVQLKGGNAYPDLRWGHFDNWLNVVCVAMGVLTVVGLQVSIVVRNRLRLRAYDDLQHNVVNQFMALGEQNQPQNIVENLDPVRKQVERAFHRIEAAAQRGSEAAGRLVANFVRLHNPYPSIEFLQAQRPGTCDLAARNREIETLAYLAGDWDAAMDAINSVLLRLPDDIDAMQRQALIYFLKGQIDLAKKNFTRVIKIARVRGEGLELATAYSNVALLHQLIEEIDDAEKRHTQALVLYRKLGGLEDRMADAYGNIGFIHNKRGEGRDAETMFRRALQINNKLDREESIAVCCGVLGLFIYNNDGDLREAERILRGATNLNVHLGRFGAVAAAYGNIGLVRAKRKDYRTARQMLLKALGIYQRLNRQKMVHKVQAMLTQLSKATPS